MALRKLASSFVKPLGLARPLTLPFSSSAVASPQPVDSTAGGSKLSTLDNGFRVASEQGAFDDTATIGVWINAGSRSEDVHGTAHFLEHMAFKGTGKRSRTDIEQQIENIGGHLNAYTSREQTVFFANVQKKDVDFAVEILSDIITNSVYDSSAIEAEKSNILTEMDEMFAMADTHVLDKLHETAYPGSGLDHHVIGTKDSVTSMTQQNIIDYVSKHYTAPRMVLVGAGAVNHDQLVSLGHQHFSHLPSTDSGPTIIHPAEYEGSDLRCHVDELPETHVALAIEGVGHAHPDFMTLQVMTNMLGAWSKEEGSGKHHASRLVSIASRDGLASSIGSFNFAYADTGLFGVKATAPPNQLEDLCWHIENEWVRMAFSVTQEEVDRAKKITAASAILGLDGPTAVAEDIGRSVLNLRTRPTTSQLLDRINAVTVDHVKAAAAEYIYDRDPVMASIGPHGNLPDYTWLRGWTYWLRA